MRGSDIGVAEYVVLFFVEEGAGDVAGNERILYVGIFCGVLANIFCFS